MASVSTSNLLNLVWALTKLKDQAWFDLGSIMKISFLVWELDKKLLPFREEMAKLRKKYAVLDPETKKESFPDQEWIKADSEILLKEMVEFPLADEKLELAIKKGVGVITLAMIETFKLIYGDNFIITEY